jgi:hypothetical protein
MKQAKVSTNIIPHSSSAASVAQPTIQLQHPIEDRRPEVIKNRRLQEIADGSSGVQHLQSLQAMMSSTPRPKEVERQSNPSTPSVAQLTGSEEPYSAHKESGAGGSSWDSNDEKKKKIWAAMERDQYQQMTEGLLGATDGAAIPTTNHILAKGRLPQFEFDLANLRLGPNATLRADDPNQAPDYNIGHDGSMTPRSRNIATAFESRDKTKLKTAMSRHTTRSHALADLDQWYISETRWKEIAKGWDQSDREDFWTNNSVIYNKINYSEPTTGKHIGTAERGLPWTATKSIPEIKKKKLKGSKNFLSRGSQIQSAELKEIGTMFQELRGRATNSRTLISRLDLNEPLQQMESLSQAEINIAQKKFISSEESSLNKLLEKIQSFDFRGADPRAELATTVEEARNDALDKISQIWEAAINKRLENRKNYVYEKLRSTYLNYLIDEEEKWLREFRQVKPNRIRPYDLPEGGRAAHLLIGAIPRFEEAMASEQDEPARIYHSAPEIAAELSTTAFEHFDALLDVERSKAEKKITENQGRPKIYTVAEIKATLLKYKIDMGKPNAPQPPMLSDPEFLIKVDRWITADKWQDGNNPAKTPKNVSLKLFNLIKECKRKYSVQAASEAATTLENTEASTE